MAYARIARVCNVAAAVCGVAHAMVYRAYVIPSYIYAVCDQKQHAPLKLFRQNQICPLFPNTAKTTFDVGKTT